MKIRLELANPTESPWTKRGGTWNPYRPILMSRIVFEPQMRHYCPARQFNCMAYLVTCCEGVSKNFRIAG